MRIVFHGANAQTFQPGFAELVGGGHEILSIADIPSAPIDAEAFRSAEVIVGIRLDASHPSPERLRLYHAPAAGVDAIDRARLPRGVSLCCCFGHEPAIAEYVMTALLLRHVPIPAADRDLRAGNWTYWASTRAALRTEFGDATLGIVGFGHIGKTVAARAKAFGLRINVINRSPVPVGTLVDRYYPLADLEAFMASADYVLVTLPHTKDTEGFIGTAALAAMQRHAVILNVGRGPVIDEQALFDALSERTIGGAIIDTWYVYPTADNMTPRPGHRPFHTLDNCTLTPHMSGWTHGTIRRRQETIAENIRRLVSGEPLLNEIRG